MRTIFYKVWFDLWNDKARTLQVVLVIALGAIGVGLVIGGRNLISQTIADQWKQAEPPHIKLAVTPPLTADQMRSLERIEGVAEVEGLLNSQVEWRLVGEEEWRTALLEGRDDFRDQKMELVTLISGAWPGRNTLGVIRTADELYGVGEGDQIEVRFGDTIRTITLTGTLKPVGPFPVVFLGQPVFYADGYTFERLTGRTDYDQIQARDTSFSREAAEAADLRIQDYFEQIGVDSVGVLFPFQSRIISPDVPPAAELLNAIFLILGLIGVIVVILGVFLVYNSISAIVSQQTNQIGVMKAIGARGWQVLYGYMPLVIAYGLLAAAVSIPVGGLSARGLQVLFVNLLNLEDPGLRFDFAAVTVQVAISLVAPVMAAFFPLRTGMRITVREAISTYGLSGAVGLVNRLVARLRRLPYSILLILGNAFRNQRRVFFIELTLVVAGAIFMMVNGVNDSTRFTFGDKLSQIHTYQISLSYENLERAQRIETLARMNPDVTAADTWLVTSAKARPASQAESAVTDARVSIFGLSPDTPMYTPELIEGRWLDPNDGRAVVVHQRLAGIQGWQVGDWVTLQDPRGDEADWQVVGIAYDPVANNAMFVSLSELQREFYSPGSINTLWVQTEPNDSASLERILAELTDVYEQRKFEIAPSSTFGEATITALIERTIDGYSLILQLLAIMAIIIALVGGVGLSGVLALNVLERRREIGVMRSIGASTGRVVRLQIGEGLLLGWLSWIIALPISIPAAYFFSTKGLSAVLFNQLAYQFNPGGALAWFAIVSALAVLASLLPARNAARLSVRESLSYQ
jgi:putative ABC transport system permease protein